MYCAYVCINYVLEELHSIHNEVKKYKFNNIPNIVTDLKNNFHFQYFVNNSKS